MISIRSARLGYRAPFASLSQQVRRHSAITRTLIAAISLALAAAVSAGGAAQAGLTTVLPAPQSILPVTAAEIRAVRSSRKRSTTFWIFTTSCSLFRCSP